MDEATGVGRTALGMAMVRAYESRRSDRLFDDPYAHAFVAADPAGFPEVRRLDDRATPQGPAGLGSMFLAHGALRTRFFDDHLVTHGRRQIVLLAAGLDTRGYRLDWPSGTRLYELDLPEVLTFKAGVLADSAAVAQCERIAVPVDLRAAWAAELTHVGFDPTEPTAWLAEGLLVYLSADEAGRLLDSIGELSAPGSTLAFEYDDENRLITDAAAAPAMARYVEMWQGGLGRDTRDRLHRQGWTTLMVGIADVAARHGRDVSSGGGFVVATFDGRSEHHRGLGHGASSTRSPLGPTHPGAQA